MSDTGRRAEAESRCERERECRAPTGAVRMTPDFAPVTPDDPLHGRQPNAGPPEFIGRMQALERLKQSPCAARIEACPVVLYFVHPPPDGVGASTQLDPRRLLPRSSASKLNSPDNARSGARRSCETAYVNASSSSFATSSSRVRERTRFSSSAYTCTFSSDTAVVFASASSSMSSSAVHACGAAQY